MIPSLGSSTISTTGLTNVKADWVVLCLWNWVCRKWSIQKASNTAFITSKYEQDGMRWALLTFPAAGAWVEREGENQHLRFVHPKQPCDKKSKSTLVTRGINARQRLFLLHRAASQIQGLCLWVAAWCAGAVWAKEGRAAGLCQGNDLCILGGGSLLWTALGAVGLAVFSSSLYPQPKVLLQIYAQLILLCR